MLNLKTMAKVKNKALYIHIPFCTHLCAYCDFPKLIYNSRFVGAFLDALIDEINSYDIEQCPSIYIGGGTPSSLNEEELIKLLKVVSPKLKKYGEFTFECNIENISKNKLLILKQYGVTRLSFGVQSFNDELLKSMNRHHNKEQTLEVIKIAKEIGFTNINIDLIYGFKEQTKELLIKDLETFIGLNIPHLSIYSLTIHKNTVFGINNYQEQDEDSSRDYYDLILDFMVKHGYTRYEVSNFALEGYESKHNQVYWNNDEYVGVGLGAEGYLDDIRYANTRSISSYIKGKTIKTKEEVSLYDKMLYEIILRLRTKIGIDKEIFKSRYGSEYLLKLENSLEQFIKDGLIILNEDYICCSDNGLMILDHILRTIFIALEE